MNTNTAAVVCKLKDAMGRYLWTDSIVAGQPPILLGYPVTTANEDMPDIASDSLAIAFGDFRRGYYVVDRLGIRVLVIHIRRSHTFISTALVVSAVR